MGFQKIPLASVLKLYNKNASTTIHTTREKKIE